VRTFDPDTDAPLVPAGVPFGATLVAFLSLSVAALTRFPPYYEDESWNYVAVFELLRGNGLTWAAFGDGRPLLGVFGALVAPFAAASPLQPEATVRAISIVAALCVLSGAFVLGRRLAPGLAWLPPMAIVSTPYLFSALRYGRNDVFALALAMWSLACAAWSRPAAAGALAGLAASVHPLFVWLAVPGLAWAARSGRPGVARYIGGGLAGILPHLAWIAINWDDVRAIIVRYAVSSSLGGHASSGLLRSVADEPRRYIEYVRAMGAWNIAVQGLVYVALTGAGLWHACKERSWPVVLLVVAPIAGTALLVQTKNPYYVYNVLACVSIVSAFGARHLAPRVRTAACLLVLAAGASSVVQYGRQAWDQRHEPTVDATTAALAARLPRDAVVIAPNLYAGLIASRPDLHFFNYHALSTRPGWGLPACAALPSRIRQLAADDPRPRPPAIARAHEAYFIAQSESLLLSYLQQIYVRSSAEDVRCMLEPAGGSTARMPVCAAAGTRCVEFQLARMPLDGE
jgi:hypothetical protein